MDGVDNIVKTAFVLFVAVLTGTLLCVSHWVRKEEGAIENSVR